VSRTTGELPRIMHEADAAVVVVDLASSQVEYANLRAMAMSGDQELPVGVDEWGRRAGLRDPRGADLAESSGPLSRVARGEPVAGELIRRDPARASDAAAGEQRRQRAAGGGGEDVDGPLWVTGFPYGTGTGRRALVVFLQLSRPGGDPEPALRMRDRAVVATDLAFTISDPSRDDDPLVWVNPAFTRTTGYSVDEVVGRNCRFLQGPDTDPEAVARLRAALLAREPVVETLLNYRKDGTAFWNQVSLTPVFDAEGRLVNYVGVQADVTERVLIQEERERALAAERRARAALALLDRVSQAVAGLQAGDGLRLVAEALTEDLLPWAAVAVCEGRRLRLAAVAGLSGAVTGRDHALPTAAAGDDPLAAIALGRVPDAEVDLSRSHPPGTVTAALAAALGAAAGPATAFAVGGRGGTLAVLLAGGPPPAADDAALLREVSRRAGLSLENARLYAREHALSEALQRAMLPEAAAVPGLDVWASYTPNLEHAQVGGDWFDVLPTADDVAVVVVGDVVGHDIEAAATMGQLRSVIRSYAYEIDDPAGVLMRADQLVRGMTITRLASVVLVVLHRLPDGDWQASWSSAGHLPGLVRRAPAAVGDGPGGPVVESLDGGRGPLLGLGDAPRHSASRRLGRGEALVLYTDGLVERRARPMPEGVEFLTDALAHADASGAAVLGERLLDIVGESPEDDAALVVVRVPEATVVPALPSVNGVRQRRLHLAADPASIRAARQALLRACADWGVARVAEAELVVSELVTNALLHGRGDVGLRLHTDGGGLRIEVEDGSPGPPQVAQGRAPGHGGYGLRIVQRLSSWGWYPTRIGKVVWAYIAADAPAVLTPR